MEELIIILFILVFIFCHSRKYIILLSFLVIVVTQYKPTINLWGTLGFLVGVFIAPAITRITYLLTYKKKLLTHRFEYKKVYIKFDVLVTVVFEEIVWREIILHSVLNITTNIYIIFMFIVLTSFLFVIAHKVKNLYQFAEMFLYTLILSFSSLFLSGMNLGLHLGRNNYIYYLESMWKKND